MNTRKDPGRNTPCPCGSGKKYKKCHGSVPSNFNTTGYYFEISRETAYRGNIGGMRQDFCIAFINRKHELFKAIEKRQMEMAEARGETITCRSGCHFCCVQFVEAGIQETEAIVYYLYHNTGALSHFLQQYPIWREELHRSGDPFKQLVHNWEKTKDGKWTDRKILVGGLTALYEHTMANIPCPFLTDSVCSIYEVRPYTCAGCFATSPAELCKPLNRNKARIYTSVQPDILNDTSFYYRDLEHPIRDLMPLMVHQILTYGLIGMPDIPGLETLPRDFMNDPEVKAIIQRYL